MIGPTLANINKLLVLLFKNCDDDPASNSFDKYYMPSHSSVLLFFDQPIKVRKKLMKN